MPRGGARPGAGRKARAVKAVESAIAEHIFRKLGGEAKAWETLIRLGGGLGARLAGELLMDLERAKFARDPDVLDRPQVRQAYAALGICGRWRGADLADRGSVKGLRIRELGFERGGVYGVKCSNDFRSNRTRR